MKAMIYEKYGDYSELHMSDMKRPTPEADEVIVKVHAVSVNRADEYMLKGNPFLIRLMNGISKPKIKVLGLDISGTVEQLGSNVTSLKVGDQVFGNTSEALLGGLAEYARIKVEHLMTKPSCITYNQAAAIPQAAVTALQAIQKADVRKGQQVLINGASGGVGLFAVQIAKAYGAKVTAVCSQRSADIVRSKGADTVIDYRQEDFTQKSDKYDVILGINGYQPLKKYKSALAEKGIYVMVGGSGKQLLQGMLLTPLYSNKNGKRLIGLGDAKLRTQDLVEIKRLVEATQIIPFVDKHFNFEETPEAFQYLMEEHAIGKVVITIIE